MWLYEAVKPPFPDKVKEEGKGGDNCPLYLTYTEFKLSYLFFIGRIQNMHYLHKCMYALLCIPLHKWYSS
jgi:hypothetical protein